MSKLSFFDKNMVYNEKYDWFAYTSWRYHRLLFKSFIFRGCKLRAFNLIINLRLKLKLKEGVDPYTVIFVALLKITPDILLYPLKLGATLQKVPLYISERKQYTYAVKWVVKVLKDKYGSLKLNNLVDTLSSAVYGKGLSIEKKISVYRLSLVNRHLVRFYKF